MSSELFSTISIWAWRRLDRLVLEGCDDFFVQVDRFAVELALEELMGDDAGLVFLEVVTEADGHGALADVEV